MKYKPNSNTPIPAKIQRGFTIIEVIIVLVIAAIITLAVFVVVPQLNRTQRNSRRVSDARRVWTASQQILGSGGSIGATGTEIIAITGTLKDPSGSPYTITVETSGDWGNYNQANVIAVTPTKVCTTQGSGGTPTVTGIVAVTVNQETSKNPASTSYSWFCISN